MPEMINPELGDPLKASSIYEFSANDIYGQPVPFDGYRGQLLCVINVPDCGEPNVRKYLESLAQIQQKLGCRGIKFLLFICDQIVCDGNDSNWPLYEDLHMRQICQVFGKVIVNGGRAHSIYKYLKKRAPCRGSSIIDKSFSLFMVDRQGVPISRQHHSLVVDAPRFEAVLRQHLEQ